MKGEVEQVRHDALLQPLKTPLWVLLLQPHQEASQSHVPHLIMWTPQKVLKDLVCQLGALPQFRDLNNVAEGHLGQAEQVLSTAWPRDSRKVRGEKF